MTNVLASHCCCNKLLKCSAPKRPTFVISRDAQAGWLLPEHLLSLGNHRTGHQPHLGYLLICPGSLSPSINSLVVGTGRTNVRFHTWHRQRLGFHLLQRSHFCNPVRSVVKAGQHWDTTALHLWEYRNHSASTLRRVSPLLGSSFRAETVGFVENH